jgi:hypothetical protein
MRVYNLSHTKDICFMPPSVFVVPRSTRWAVTRGGAIDDTSLHRSRAEAIAVGQAIAEREGVELIVYERRKQPRDGAPQSHGYRA